MVIRWSPSSGSWSTAPFAVWREDPALKSWSASRRPGGLSTQTTGCAWTPYDLGGTGDAAGPRGEAIGRRIQKIRETGTAQHANWGAMDWCAEQGILKYAMDPDGAVSSLPSAYFAPAKGFTRRQVYEAFRE